MTLPGVSADRTPPNAIVYLVECHSCAASYDTAQAAWCNCIAKERTLLCPNCRRCFCAADVEYKRKFWTNAPEPLWQRKVRRARQDAALPPNPSVADVRRPLVLVVDDDRQIRAVAAHMVSSLGFGCIHAANGTEGLVLAHAYKPEVVLTDALMPKMDGRELCRMIKSEPDLAGIKVVVMSSVYTSGRFKREALSQFKADDYVAKPIDADRLLALVKGEQPSAAIESAPERFLIVAENLVGNSEMPAAGVRLTVVPDEDQPVFSPPAAAPQDSAEAEPSPFEISLEALFSLDDATTDPTAIADIQPSRLTAADLIHLRALGVEMVASLVARIPTLAPADLIALHAAGVPCEFIEAIDPELLEGLTPHDLVLLHSSGLDSATVNVLRGLGYSAAEIVGVGASAVSPVFVRDVIASADRQLSAADVMRLHFAGVDAAFIRALHSAGYGGVSVDEWIRLWAAGVSAEFIQAATESLREPCSPTELIRLRTIGVDAALLRRIARTG